METAKTAENWLFVNASGWREARNTQRNNSMLHVEFTSLVSLPQGKNREGGSGCQLKMSIGSKDQQGSR